MLYTFADVSSFLFHYSCRESPVGWAFPDPHLAKRQRTMDRGVIGKTFQGQTDEENIIIFAELASLRRHSATGG